MEKLSQRIKQNKKFIIIFLAIMFVGIFLRTYHYSDLLRFGKDQARDAGIIQDIVLHNAPLPLLGPKAGGTDFQMGPIFYYFQVASAKIFGDAPDKMAYPDLLFSILTIPLLFFFLKKYFKANISLALTALYAVSFFAVQNGRFAWNPNSLPLFSLLFLYGILELANPKQTKKILWAIVVGIAMGIGFQLHTLYILIVGIVFVIFSAYLVKRKMLSFKNIAIILAVVFILNLPQIISEFRTDGGNAKAFFAGIDQKSVKKNPFPLNFAVDAAWHIQANTMFVYPSGDDSKSQFGKVIENIQGSKKGVAEIWDDNYAAIIQLFLGTILSIVGYFLLGFYLKKETDEQKKNFLKLLALYMTASFLVLASLSQVLILRYFLMLQFVPIILLGLMMKFLHEKYGKEIFYLSFVAVFALSAYNIYAVITELNTFLANKGDVQIAIWGEEKSVGDFISSHSDPGQAIYFIYEPQSANKFIRSLSYFNESIDAPAESNDSTTVSNPNTAYFSLILNKKSDKQIFKRFLARSKKFVITGSAVSGRLEVYKLELKAN